MGEEILLYLTVKYWSLEIIFEINFLYNIYISLFCFNMMVRFRRKGTLVQLGLSTENHQINQIQLMRKTLRITGSIIGGMVETQARVYSLHNCQQKGVGIVSNYLGSRCIRIPPQTLDLT